MAQVLQVAFIIIPSEHLQNPADLLKEFFIQHGVRLDPHPTHDDHSGLLKNPTHSEVLFTLSKQKNASSGTNPPAMFWKHTQIGKDALVQATLAFLRQEAQMLSLQTLTSSRSQKTAPHA